MSITLNLVREQLKPYRCRDFINTEKEVRFTRICILPENGKDLHSETLYAGELSLALSLRAEGKDFFCVCIRDTEPAAETESAPLSGLLLLEDPVSVRTVFSELQDLFYRVSEWVSQMFQCAYEKKPLQDVLDLSEPVIGNFISISDSALNLVCCTRHIRTDDPVSSKLIENGFHPEESVEVFRKQGLFEQWDHAKGLIINKSHSFSPYDLCSKVFKLHNTYYIHAVMTCCSRPLSPGLIDLFRMLTEVVELYVRQDWKEHTFLHHDYDRFLIELIEGHTGSVAVVENRAKQLHLPFSHPYQLCLIEFLTLDKLPVGKIGIELSGKFPEARVTVYQNRILMLFSSYSAPESGFVPKEKIASLLERADARCAVSSVFSALPEIQTAYEQTRLALKYFSHSKKDPVFCENPHSCVTEFDDCFQLILLGENPASRTMWKLTQCHRMLKRVSAYDEKHGTDNLRVLYTYLFSDRSATETGQLLHMHRNNVLYRIGRIEEMMGAKLSDAKVRHALFCGFSFLQLYGV